MKKRLTLPMRMQLTRHVGQTVQTVEIESGALAGWCLGLCLLKEKLISELIVQAEGAKGTLSIQLAEETLRRTRTQASLDPIAARLRMTPDDLDYVLHFYLRNVRDCAAEVDHVDMDVESQSDSQSSTITFKAPDSRRPLSADEARKRLGLS